MKKLKASALGVLLAVCFLHSEAQDQKIPLNEPDHNKPKLFNHLPQKMTLKLSEVESVFNYAVGAVVNVKITDNLLFQGTVVSKSEDATVKSIVVRSANLQGVAFTFSKTTKEDGSFNYVGRIMSRNSGDAYEVKTENGQYILQKKNLYDLIAE